MKNKILKSVYYLAFITISSGLFLLSSCGDDPTKENTPELITKVTLTFAPVGGGGNVVATATDPDGAGIQDLTTDGPIILQKDVSYTLTLALINELASPTSPEYDITSEVQEEGDEHLFFFSWTSNLFSSPSGDGNIDNRADELNYGDVDDSGYPIGIITNWTAGPLAGTGAFRLVLKHQPGLKSATSGANVGTNDLDITFEIEIK